MPVHLTGSAKAKPAPPKALCRKLGFPWVFVRRLPKEQMLGPKASLIKGLVMLRRWGDERHLLGQGTSGCVQALRMVVWIKGEQKPWIPGEQKTEWYLVKGLLVRGVS